MIRLATLDDLESICSIEKQFDAEAFNKSSLRRFILNDQTVVLHSDKIILGYATLLSRKNSKQARLYSIAIAEEYQGRRLGLVLMSAVEDIAIDNGHLAITLEVSWHNKRAIQLYTRMGYKEIDILDNYYKDGTSAIKMKKVIAK
jgi:ribosomal protein S18 acetylase RimI-like enzyme